MSTIADKTTVRELFVKSVRSAGLHAYPSAYLPEADVQQPVLQQVYRVGQMKELQLDRENLSSVVRDVLSATEYGVITKLSAGTGVGKSTKVPMQFALQLNGIVVVVSPRQSMAECVCEYLSNVSTVAGQSKVSVCVVTNLDQFMRVAAPAVVYIGATEFWFLLYENRHVLRDRNVAVVCFDESHERIPQYVFASFMVTTDVFKKTKLFMMSATATSDNLEYRPKGIRHDLHAVKPEFMNYEQLGMMSPKSPLHYSRATKPFMVFLPNDEIIDQVAAYYVANGVMVHRLYSDASSKRFQAVNNVLTTTKCAMVLLLTPAHETFYTFKMENVVDCGLTEDFEIDMDTGAVTLPIGIVTMSQRVQRCGRVGRYQSGSAWYVDAETAPEDYEMHQRGCMYLALWAKLFNVQLALPWLTKWDTVVAGLSPTCVRILLAAKVHPWLMVNYLTVQGTLLSGLKPLVNHLLVSGATVSSSGAMLCGDDKHAWLSRTIGDKHNLGDMDPDYEVPVDIPPEWAVLGYVLYQAIMGYKVADMFDHGKLVHRGKSVISYVSTARSVCSESAVGGTSRVPFQNPAAELSAGRRMHRFEEVLTPQDSISEVGSCDKRVSLTSALSVPSSGELPGYRSTTSLARGVKVVQRVTRHDSVADVSDTRDRLGVTLSRANSQRVTSAGDGNLTERESVARSEFRSSLRVVKAADIRDVRVRPYNDGLMSLMIRMRLEDQPLLLYRELKACNVEIATMAAADMRRYFVAVVSVWNRKVSNKIQHEAAPYSGMFAEHRNELFHKKTRKALRRCRGFLQAFEHHGFVLAEFSGVEQCGVQLPEMASHSGAYAAAWVLAAGTEILRKRVAIASNAVGRFVRSDGKTGCYVVSGNTLMVARHVVCVEGGGVSIELPRHDVSNVRLADVVRLTLTVVAGAALFARGPVLDEFVIVVSKDMSGVAHTFGVYKVMTTGVLCDYNADLFDGASGSLVIAVSDGALLGFHHGVMVSDDKGVVSNFVPL